MGSCLRLNGAKTSASSSNRISGNTIDVNGAASPPTEKNISGRTFSRVCNKDEDSLCNCLCKAARSGEWKTAEEIVKEESGILSKIISEDRKETALHIATRFNKVSFVEKLVEQLDVKDLEATNIYGDTALCIASTVGAVGIASSMLKKHKGLLGNATHPILIAARYKHKVMVDYLLKQMDYSNMAIHDQMELLLAAIHADFYDVALDILEKMDPLAVEKSDINGYTLPLLIMAQKSNVIASYNKTTKWQSYAKNKSWFKCIFKKTPMKIKAHEMVKKMWSSSSSVKSSESLEDDHILHEAARVGNVEFLEVLLNANPELIRKFDKEGKSIFHVAVENRQEGVFNLIYDMNLFYPDDLLHYFDDEKVSLLQLAAKKARSCHLDPVLGAFFQMHRELLWFKEVENIEELTMRSKKKGNANCGYDEIKEREKQTAVTTRSKKKELFIQEHRELMEEGEKWVKKTANSCMLVATLIATVIFAAAFTVPGGKNETTGIPIFLDSRWFTVFVISDGIGMISASTSILLFLSILTSRCAENDLLFWLPLELAGGLGFLFVSVLSMVLAFGATFFLYYANAKGKDTTSPLPFFIIALAVVPIFWFCMLQWKLWAHALRSLYSTAMSCWPMTKKTSVLRRVTRGVFVRL